MSQSSTSLGLRFVAYAARMLFAASTRPRWAQQALVLTCGVLLVTGRGMLSRMLVVLGLGGQDWSTAYRLFRHERIDLSRLQSLVVAEWARLYPARKPLVVVIDGTHLPRTGKKMPGAGFTRAPRTPAWRPGIHLAQRFEGVSGLTPPTAAGDCRTIPLWFEPAPTPSARPWDGYPPRKEWEAAIDGLTWLRSELSSQSQGTRRVLAVADGAYTGANMWNALPAHTILLARCAKNRALFALPDTQPARGRKRCYGPRGATPMAQLHEHPPMVTVETPVRGKARHIRTGVSGPWLVKPAPDHPLFLITIRGIKRKTGTRHRTREPIYLLVNAKRNRAGTWVLPETLPTLIHWAWQRWKVETMHRELKSGFGLGDQQQWSAPGAVTMTRWIVWVYAVMILAALGDQRQIRRHATTRWYRGRRWTPRDVQTQLRHELWSDGPHLFGRVCHEHGITPSKWPHKQGLNQRWDSVSYEI